MLGIRGYQRLGSTRKIKDKDLDKTSVVRQSTEAVENYMKHTLGTIPGAQIDYEVAKRYLANDLAVQFDRPGFVPISYCIQDGPEKVRIKSKENLGDRTAVKVEASWGDEWTERWEFILVSENGQWKINKINCLYKP